MNEKEKILNIIYKYITKSGEVVNNINDFDKYEPSLSDMIRSNWNSQNEFFNELAEFGLNGYILKRYE